MLLSFANNIEPILNVVIGTGATKILDVGCGQGKYGLLIREAVASVRAEGGDMCPDLSDVKIDAVENAEYFYKQGIIQHIYDDLYRFDVTRNFVKDLYNDQELILLIDVIEHWTKEQFYDFMYGITSKVLISTPKHTTMFKEWYYGTHPHITQWAESDFDRFEKKTDYSTNDSHIYLIN